MAVKDGTLGDDPTTRYDVIAFGGEAGGETVYYRAGLKWGRRFWPWRNSRAMPELAITFDVPMRVTVAKPTSGGDELPVTGFRAAAAVFAALKREGASDG